MNIIKKVFGNDNEHFANESEYNINKELFYKVLDTDPAALLFFTKQNGWIGANKAFFDLVPLQNIEQLRTQHESIRELFDHEDEEVFTEVDKSWLDYIRTHCPRGYGLGIIDPHGNMRSLVATCTLLHQGKRPLSASFGRPEQACGA